VQPKTFFVAGILPGEFRPEGRTYDELRIFGAEGEAGE